MLARQWLVNLAAGVPISIWYDWHDDGVNPNEPEHHFGTVANEYHAGRTPVYDPKPAYIAAQTLAHTLAGYQFETRLRQPDDRGWLLQFRRGQQRAWAAWTDVEPKSVQLSVAPGDYTIVSHLGKITQASASSNALPLELSDGVQYVVPR